MYKSPIRIDYITRTSELISDIAKSMNEGLENKIMAKVQAIIDVDKDELIRALAYDRNQYEKGYEDGIKDVREWIEKWQD